MSKQINFFTKWLLTCNKFISLKIKISNSISAKLINIKWFSAYSEHYNNAESESIFKIKIKLTLNYDQKNHFWLIIYNCRKLALRVIRALWFGFVLNVKVVILYAWEILKKIRNIIFQNIIIKKNLMIFDLN